MNTITEQEGSYHLRFKYSPRIIDAVKRLGVPGIRYNGSGWEVPAAVGHGTIENFAKRYGFSFIVNDNRPQRTGEIPPLPELTIDIPLKRNLFPYQKTGVQYILNKKRLIVGDQPGLGKTGQAIAAITAAQAFPCIVICPSSLKENWKREVEIWTNKKAMILNDGCKNNFHRYHAAGLADFFIVNFESLKKYFVHEIKKKNPRSKGFKFEEIVFWQDRCEVFKSVIIDESHRIKSASAQQTKFCKGITMGKEFILCLTGTPVVNKPVDLWTQLYVCNRLQDFGGYKNFMNRYCSGSREASNLKELNYLLNVHCFYRRDKSEVLKDLPPKTRQVVYCDISTRKEYNEALASLATYLKQYKEATDEQIAKSLRGEVMVRIGILKNISARGKLAEVIEFINDTLASGEKLVLFGHLKDVLGKIKEHYPDAVSVTGDDHPKVRQIAVDSFQNDPDCKLIVCSIQAAGVGLTLTASSRVAFVEMGWHPAIHDQCEDRCHRIGQHDNVTCTYFLGKDTIDEWVYSIIDEKRGITNEVTGAIDDVDVNVINKVIDLFNQQK